MNSGAVIACTTLSPTTAATLRSAATRGESSATFSGSPPSAISGVTLFTASAAR